MTPGTADAVAGTDWLSCPDPLAVLTMRSALIASSTLLVADLESEAPNTDIAATRARPTMSAEAVWAVRRGLRMEFSRPSLPGSPSTRASGRPITLEIGRAIAGASMATPTKMPTAPTPTSAMAGLASPMASMTTPTRARAAPQANRRRGRGIAAGLAVVERGDRGDAHGIAGRADRGHYRHADADGEPDQDSTRLEHQRSRRQRNPEPAQERL